MSAKDKPVSKPMSKQFEENYDRIFKRSPPIPNQKVMQKDRVDLGLSPSCIVVNINSEDLK